MSNLDKDVCELVAIMLRAQWIQAYNEAIVCRPDDAIEAPHDKQTAGLKIDDIIAETEQREIGPWMADAGKLVNAMTLYLADRVRRQVAAQMVEAGIIDIGDLMQRMTRNLAEKTGVDADDDDVRAAGHRARFGDGRPVRGGGLT